MKPYIHINCAISIDGKLALPSGMQTPISDREDLIRVHKLRNEMDGILVGANTVISDDPSLRVKEEYLNGTKVRVPARIVLDGKGRIPFNAKVLDGTIKTYIIASTSNTAIYPNAEKIVTGETVILAEALDKLYQKGIRKLLVEGGGDTIWYFVSSNLYDIITVFVGNIIIGGRSGPTMAGGEGASDIGAIAKLRLYSVERKENGILITYLPLNRA